MLQPAGLRDPAPFGGRDRRRRKIKFTIAGNPATKKNQSQLIYSKKAGRHLIIPSKKYIQYRDNALDQVENIPQDKIDYPVNVKAIYYRQDRRRVDLCNLHEALCDLFVELGVVDDDNSRIIVSMDGSRVDYDKENPRTEVEITRIENYTHPFDRKN